MNTVKNMRLKLIHIGILAILSVGFFYAGWYMHPPIASLKLMEAETARLRIDGEELKILTNTYSTNRNFIFLDNDTDDIVTTLSVVNVNIEPPSYSIIKGQTRDWLVVTKIYQSGIGYMSRYDAWYILNRSGIIKEVLTYPSQGHELPDNDGNNTYWTSKALTEGYSNDSAVDIVTTTKNCSATDEGSDKDCTESSHTVHYVWDAAKEKFVVNGI